MKDNFWVSRRRNATNFTLKIITSHY